MFSVVSKNFKVIPALIVMSLSVIWVVDSPAENKADQASDVLPAVSLQDVTNLNHDGHEAREKQIPILMFFSMKHCPYCVEVEEDYLKPILRNREYDGKVIIRKVRIDGTNSMRDFTGKERDIEEFGDDYNVSMVPTLVLVDSNGKQLTPSIRGISNSHYYSAELDTAIDISTQKLRTIAKR